MNREQADQLITLINSFVEEDVTDTNEELPIVVPEKELSELTEEEVKKLFRNTVPEGFNFGEADLVRNGTTGDKVWLRFNGTKRWIPDLETLEKMGYDLGDVHDIKDDEIKDLKEEFSLYPARLW